MNEDIAAPAVFDGLPHGPFAFVRLFHRAKQHQTEPPRQLCSKLLHKFAVCQGITSVRSIASLIYPEA
jgi:hypothetical protein